MKSRDFEISYAFCGSVGPLALFSIHKASNMGVWLWCARALYIKSHDHYIRLRYRARIMSLPSRLLIVKIAFVTLLLRQTCKFNNKKDRSTCMHCSLAGQPLHQLERILNSGLEPGAGGGGGPAVPVVSYPAVSARARNGLVHQVQILGPVPQNEERPIKLQNDYIITLE